MKSKTESIIEALRVLARDIHTDDGIVNACLEEAAGRLEELQRELKQAIAEKIPPSYGLLNDQIKHLNEQIRYMQQALNYEIADGKKARDEVDVLKQELAWNVYINELANVTDAETSTDPSFLSAPARQRAEAFLRTLGKWEEAE